ncbi:hypothetical protein Y032_0037g3489 [Ancylostoma ceylanicum]|uniref:Uncharacterized protein n=1 Tax=Ancylostoma ceylanicum TaxID=53326 RepID=A0A016UKK0_9BILA|nr:hypothetical protein Y032_0037g3489 [Ancylostoma ceylanicum]
MSVRETVASRMNAYSARQKASSATTGWVRPGSSSNMLSCKDPPNYAKRSYEGNVLPPVQKSARLEPDISTARQAFERPLFPTQPFLEKAALDRRSYGESRFDSLDLPTRQVSESWRTNDKNLGSRGAERSYDKDSWVHSGSRGSSSEKNAANAVSSVWRSEPVPPKKVPLNKQRSYSPAPREDDNFDTEEMTKPAKLVREPDTATNKKKGSYETLMKVVMGSINPRGLNTSYPADSSSTSRSVELSYMIGFYFKIRWFILQKKKDSNIQSDSKVLGRASSGLKSPTLLDVDEPKMHCSLADRDIKFSHSH